MITVQNISGSPLNLYATITTSSSHSGITADFDVEGNWGIIPGDTHYTDYAFQWPLVVPPNGSRWMAVHIRNQWIMPGNSSWTGNVYIRVAPYPLDSAFTPTPGGSTPTPIATPTLQPTFTPEPLPTCSSCVLERILQELLGGCVPQTASASHFSAVQADAVIVSEQTPEPEFDINLFYRVRDELLSQSPQGQHYIDLYETYSPEIAETIVMHPQLINEAVATIQLWEPDLQAYVDSQGNAEVIS